MPGARAPRRFDQASATDVLTTVGCTAVAVLLFALGRALRVVDDALVDLGPIHDTDGPTEA